VIVNVDVTVTPTLAGANTAATVGAAGAADTAVGQAVLPALVGALVVALVDPTLMVAVSVAPWESVTRRVNVPDPVTVTCALDAPERMVVPPPAVHW